MRFINVYYNTKIGALSGLLGFVKSAWDNRQWVGFILTALWTLFCTTLGVLFFPIDIIVCAIYWYKNPDARDEIEEIVNEITPDRQ